MGRAPACAVVLAAACTLALAACGSDGTAAVRPGDAARPGDGPRSVLQAFDVGDGRMRWSIDVDPSQGSSAPVIVGDTVILGQPGVAATAFSLNDGTVRWSAPGYGLPQAVTADLAVFSERGRLEARRVDTGAIAWTRETGGFLIQSHEPGPIALMVDPEVVAARADCTPAADPAQPGMCRLTPSLPRPGEAPTPFPPNEVSVLDPATGQDLWKVTVPGRVDPNNSKVTGRHVMATHTVDRNSATQSVAALQVEDGSMAWSVPATSIRHLAAAGDIPAVVAGMDEARATALDPETGATLWEAATDQSSWLAPFIETMPGEAYRRDPHTGQELPGRVRTAYEPAAHGDLLVGALEHTLTAVRAADQIWTAALPEGPRPLTTLDMTGDVVVALTGVGHPEHRD